MRFNHLELTFEPGTLDAARRDDINAFYGDLFGWAGHDIELHGQKCFYVTVDADHFILCAESTKFMRSTGYDHLGLLVDSREEVDALLAKAKEWQARDDRIQIEERPELVAGGVILHAFYVKHLLPIWFDVQVIEPDA
jgi:hypothetical protein